MLIGEVFGSTEDQKRFLGENLDGLNLAFLWELLNLKSNAPFLRNAIEHYEHHYPEPYTPVYVYGNHDRKRLISHIEGDIHSAKLLALMQFTVRGVPVTYYGEEIGMVDGAFPAKTALDPVAKKFAWIPSFLLDRLGLYVNRDGCRTPMQWDSGPNAGFCSAGTQPWLPVPEGWEKANVADQVDDESSLLNLYRALLRLRRDTPALRMGSLELISDGTLDERVLAYKRCTENQTLLILINFGEKIVHIDHLVESQNVIFTINMPQPVELPVTQLLPFTGIILEQI
jgi:glycosidase